jgi:peptide/nickel transport system permease protein
MSTLTIPLESAPASPQPRSRGAWRRLRTAWRRLPGKTKVGAIVLGCFVVVAAIGPYLAPYDPSFQTPAGLHGPSVSHLLGTTSTGQDVLSQLLAGTRATVVIGLATGLIGTALAVLVGITAGFRRGWWDEVLSLVTNVFLVLPALPLLVVLLAYQSARGELGTIIVLSALGWPFGARVIRAQTLTVSNRDFVAAAREVGEPTWRILGFEILPNEVSLIAATFVGTVLYAVGASVALAFLGLTDTSQWSLGTIMFWAQTENALQLGAWWWFIPPGLAVALIGTALALINFGLDELGNPRLRDSAARQRSARGRRPSDPTPVLHRPARPRRAGRPLAAPLVLASAASPPMTPNGTTRHETVGGELS